VTVPGGQVVFDLFLKIGFDALHGVDMSVWRAVRETSTARGENR
jgi:hypothetical protein